MTSIWTLPARLHSLTTLKLRQTRHSVTLERLTTCSVTQTLSLTANRFLLPSPSPLETVTPSAQLKAALYSSTNPSLATTFSLCPVFNLVSTSATPSMYTWDIDSSAARLHTAHAKNGLYLLNIPSKAKVESKANLADSDSKAHLDLEVHKLAPWQMARSGQISFG